MKRISYIIAAAMAMISSIACSVDEIGNPSVKKTPLVFTASFDATKANIDENGKFSWAAGDKVMVITNAGTEEVEIKATDIQDGVATIRTTTLDEADTYYAVFPSINYKEITENGLRVQPKTYQYAEEQKTCVSVCSSEEMNFIFHNSACLIKFDTDIEFHHAIFDALGAEKVIASYFVNPETGERVSTKNDGSEQVLYYTSSGEHGPYFIELSPDITMTKGFSIRLFGPNTDADLLATCTYSSSITTARNKILNIKNFDSRLDGTYTVTLSDDSENPLPTRGGSVTLPSREGNDTYTFAGWSTTNIEEETSAAPTIIPAGTYTPQADVTLYPVYSRTAAASFKLSLTDDDTEYYVGTQMSGKYVLNAPTSQSEAAVFYIENNQYLFYYVGETKTYVSHSSKSDLSFGTTDPKAWTISETDNVITFTSTIDSNRYLGFNYNNGNSRFGAYVDDEKYPHIFTKHTVSAGETYYVSIIPDSGEGGDEGEEDDDDDDTEVASFTISSADVVTNSSYAAYTATVDERDWVITFGGNNKSVGTNSGSRNNCNLNKYSKYAVSPVTTSNVASAFACTTKLSGVKSIKYTIGGGSNQTNTKVYVLYSADGNTFSQVSLTSGNQGGTISSGTTFKFASCSGYFAVLFAATNSSGNWRIDDVVLSFNEPEN